MRYRTVRRILWAAGATGIAASGAVAWIGVTAPLARTSAVPSAALRSASTRAATAPAEDARVGGVDVRRVADLDLRRPLYDPPAVQAPTQPPPSLALRLLGTVVETGHSRALLVGPDGKLQLKSVGDSLAGAEILRIGPDTVTVRHLDADVELKVERKQAGG